MKKLLAHVPWENKTIRLFGIVILLLLIVAPSVYFYSKYQKTQQLLQNPTAAAKEEVKALVAKVSSIIELPKGEEPTVATVSDKGKLKDQPFFINAENGDKVLIYTMAKKAILYRPSTNKVIEVAPVNIGPSSQGSSGQGPVVNNPTSPTPSVTRITLYNGTNTVGLTKTVEKDLGGKISNIAVIAKENASKDDYEETIVIDLDGTQKATAAEIAKAVGGTVGTLPEGEEKPEDTDILVIIGSDYTSK